jgi:DNA mismatch repair protein MutS2
MKAAGPGLAELSLGLVPIPSLFGEIGRCIDDEGLVRDSASPELARIRQKQRTLANRIRDRLDSLIHSQAAQKMLQDPIVTLRGGRYVVPVKSEYRSQFQGIVHDQSASGATVFMEPAFAVELNNELRLAEQAEQAEIERILRSLSEAVASHAGQLLHNLEVIAELDAIFARAKFSRAIGGTEPIINDRGFIRIKQGRHPLLSGEVVPIDVWLGDDFHVLVITGPNTGGKTVTLKTVGLFCLMAQAGLHVPAHDGSELAVFSGIYADIGDEQSIEQSLSTFSSHMTNIIEILQAVTPNSLVLLDELGAGTDPAEGAALATVILEYLRVRGVRTIATTHYSELKNYAYGNPDVENASVEFDVETLRPTYKLAIGVPGRSNAFAISQRLGLDASLVEAAQELLGADHVRTEDLIGEIERDRRQTAQAREEAEALRREYERLRSEYARRLQALEEEKDAVLAEARAEQERLLAEARSELDRLLGEVRRLERGEAEEQVKLARERIISQQEDLAKQRPKPAAKEGPTQLKPGEQIRIKSLRQLGYVLEPPTASGEVLVQAGIMKITVPVHDLERVDQQPAKVVNRSHSTGTSRLSKSSTIRSELDIRGKTVEEGLALLDKYLDDAFLSSLARVRIIHGKGTGALRAAVKDYLRSHPFVKDFQDGAPNEGGSGVSVVELDISR